MLELILFSISVSSIKSEYSSNILYLSETNFSSTILSLPATFLMVQQGFSIEEKLQHQSQFLSAAQRVGSRCYFAVMDGDQNQNFLRRLSLRFKQEFFFYRFGKLTNFFNGPFTATHYENFALSKTGPAFTTFDDYLSAQDFIESSENAVVLFLERAVGTLFESFSLLSSMLRDNYSFGVCSDEFLADELGVDLIPSIVLFRSQDRARVFFPEAIESASQQDITLWLTYHKKLRYEPFALDDQKTYTFKKSVILFFVPIEEIQCKQTLDLITQLASKYDDDLRFCQIDAISGRRFMLDLGFSPYSEPAAAILKYVPYLQKVIYPENDDWNFNALSRFIEDYFDSEISSDQEYSY